jgi:hypothetical protein
MSPSNERLPGLGASGCALQLTRHRLDVELPRLDEREVALGIDHRHGRPRLDRVVAPHPVLAVVDDRVEDSEPVAGLGDPLGDALGHELAGVDADDG